jgi:hypothetical protein
MARAGDDVRLTEMLLEVATDLEAEAEAIEAEQKAINLRPVPSPEAPPPWFRGIHTSSGDLPTGVSATVAKRWAATAASAMAVADR